MTGAGRSKRLLNSGLSVSLGQALDAEGCAQTVNFGTADTTEAVTAFLEKGPAAEELERSKGRMIADYVYAQDNQSTLARMYGQALTTGQTVAMSGGMAFN